MSHLHVYMAASAICMLLQVRGEDACKNGEGCWKAKNGLEGISTLQHNTVRKKIMGTMLKTGEAEEERREFSYEVQTKSQKQDLKDGYCNCSFSAKKNGGCGQDDGSFCWKACCTIDICNCSWVANSDVCSKPVEGCFSPCHERCCYSEVLTKWTGIIGKPDPHCCRPDGNPADIPKWCLTPTPAPAAPPPAPAPAPPQACVDSWNQCNRTQFDCCEAGFRCYQKNKYYAQCRNSCPPSTNQDQWSCEVLS